MNRVVTAVVAEDEETLRQELIEALAQVWPELSIVAEARDGIAALRAVAEHQPDVIFLDIQMPGATGLEVARHLSGSGTAALGGSPRASHIVFVTAYDQFALEAFDAGAVDYLLKPLAMPRLFTTVSRLKQRLKEAPADLSGVLAQLAQRSGGAKEAPSPPARAPLRWINASVGQTLRLLTVDEILYFQSDTKYTRVVTRDAEALIRKPLKELVEELDPHQFWQIHRSTLVNVAAIAGATRDFRSRLQLKLKDRSESLLVAESYTHRFKEM